MVPITNAAGLGTPTIGGVIPTGSKITALGVDSKSNAWVNVQGSSAYVIADGSSTATPVTVLLYPAGFTPTPSFASASSSVHGSVRH